MVRTFQPSEPVNFTNPKTGSALDFYLRFSYLKVVGSSPTWDVINDFLFFCTDVRDAARLLGQNTPVPFLDG